MGRRKSRIGDSGLPLHFAKTLRAVAGIHFEVAESYSGVKKPLKPRVVIKGSKEGLLFLLDEEGDFAEILKELDQKLLESNHHFFTGPLTHVSVQLGKRELEPWEEVALRRVLSRSGNLVLKDLGSTGREDDPSVVVPLLPRFVSGVIRSGQVLSCQESLILLGDVNPGGKLISNGDILVFGALRGEAYAGAMGRRDALIVAGWFQPTQLRIAHVASRSMEDWAGEETAQMQFAYLQGEDMVVERLHRLSSLRPEWSFYQQE